MSVNWQDIEMCIRDREKLDLHQRVRQGYLDLAQAEPERIKIIDASQAFEDVVEEAWKVIKGYL